MRRSVKCGDSDAVEAYNRVSQTRESPHREYRCRQYAEAYPATAAILRPALDGCFSRNYSHPGFGHVASGRPRSLDHIGFGSHRPIGGGVWGLGLRLLATLVESQRQPGGADSELPGSRHHCRRWQLMGNDGDPPLTVTCLRDDLKQKSRPFSAFRSL